MDPLEQLRQLAQQENMAGGLAGQALFDIGEQDAFIDQMIDEAGGNRDFVIKQLDAAHDIALGTDDQARANFLEQVADRLEKRIGRIPYDYERYTERELEDFARGTERTEENKAVALQRLAEDEQLLQQKLGEEETQAVEEQQTALNRRGLITGPQGENVGLGGQFENRLQQALARRRTALERELGRDVENTKLEASRKLEDLGRVKERNLQDITTEARRGAIDTQQEVKFGKEKAQRDFETRKRQLERERADRRSAILSTMPTF